MGDHDVSNFNPLVVHDGSNPMEWLKLTVKPKANTESDPRPAGASGGEERAFRPVSAWRARPIRCSRRSVC
jgi:hypothetical protein